MIPRRERGQNFLVDTKALVDIVDAAQLSREDTVLEIGPGFGVLTEALVQRAGHIIAVELDRVLMTHLQERFAEDPRVTIVQDDIVQWWESERFKYLNIETFKYFKVVANLPYQITSHILRIMLESEHRPQLIVVMVQKEVAERIVAKPGEMSMLSVMVQYYGAPEIIHIVPRTSFWPEPAVDSAIVRIKPHAHPLQDGEREFFRLVKIGFASRRKQLQNNLSVGLHVTKEEIQEILVRAGLDEKVRAQELSVDDWKRLASLLS